MRRALVAAALLASALAGARSVARADQPLGWQELLRADERLCFAPGVVRAPLGFSFVQFGSEVVRNADSALVRNRDYGIDYGRGVVFLLAAPAESLCVDVAYLRLPGPRARQFQALPILSREEALGAPTAPTAAPGKPAAASAPREVGLPPGLQLSGSKTIGVSLGRNREAALEQSLRVQVSGNLSADLRVNAVLADDNLPVVPEGNTEELGDLDRVFIEMQGPVIGGVVGDYDIGGPPSVFANYDRQLRGAEVRARWHGQEASLGGGLARGELQTATFRGSEGKQGPYALLSARRLEASTILPGSERVYVDGVLLRRGENQDYIVDYVRGELRFTTRRRITADTEVAVDFQVTTERFRRGTRTSRLGLQTRGWSVQGHFVQEADDEDEPVGEPLTAAEIELLQASGDAAAVASGISVVGPGNGDYRADALDSTIVVYAPDDGDLDVTFYETGAGRGSYDDRLDAVTGRRYFLFVGAGVGGFDIGRLLLPPNRTRLATATLQGSPWSGARLQGEASYSLHDGNLFSSIGDDDNGAEALDLLLAPFARGVGGGHLAWDVHVSQLSPRFKALGRARPGFYYKDWNAEQDSLRTTERVAETTLRYERGGDKPWLKLAANAGALDRGDDLETQRGQFEFGLGRGERGLDVHWQRLDSDRPLLGAAATRRRQFARAGARYRLGPFVPQLGFESDEFVRADIDSLARPSYRYRDGRAALGIGGPTLGANIEFGRRDTDARQPGASTTDASAWQAERRNDTYGVSVLGRPSRSWNTEIAWSRRTFEPADASAGSGSNADLGRVQLRFDPPAGAIRAEWRYEIADEETRLLEQVLVLAADGKGDYDAEGRSVGKDQGEYDKVYRFLGDTESTTQLVTSLRFEIGGVGWRAPSESTTAWWKRNLGFVQVLSVQEQTRDAPSGLFWLDPGAFQSEATVFGSFRARQEWSFLEGSLDQSLRLFLDWEDDLDGRFADERIDTRRSRATLRFEQSGTRRWAWSAEGEGAWRERDGGLDAIVPGRPAAGEFDIRLQRLQASLAFRPTPSERLALDVAATHQNDRLSQVRQQLVALTPAAVLAPLRNLRLLLSVTATRVFESNPGGALPPYLFDAPGTKTTATGTGSYRLARILNLNLSATSVRNTDGRSTYDVKLETRALF